MAEGTLSQYEPQHTMPVSELLRMRLSGCVITIKIIGSLQNEI